MANEELPEGWILYSVLDAGKPDADRDYGATRRDGRARCFGVRAPGGEPLHVRASVQPLRGEGTFWRDRVFPADALGDACAWCDAELRDRDEQGFGWVSRCYVEELQADAQALERAAAACGEEVSEFLARHWFEVVYGKIERARRNVPQATHRPDLHRRMLEVRYRLDEALASAAGCLESLEQTTRGVWCRDGSRHYSYRLEVTGHALRAKLRQGRLVLEIARDAVRTAVKAQRVDDWHAWRELVDSFPCLRSREVRTVKDALDAANAHEDTPAGEAALFVLHVAEPDKQPFWERKLCQEWDAEHRAAFDNWTRARWFVTREI